LKGNIFYEAKAYFLALKMYNKALEINPDLGYAWNNKGSSLNKLGRYKEAINCYDKSLEINPDDEYARKNKEITLQKLRNRDSRQV